MRGTKCPTQAGISQRSLKDIGLYAASPKIGRVMIASIYKIITDSEGESKITFAVPSSELINVVKLNQYLQKEIRISISDKYEDLRNEKTV